MVGYMQESLLGGNTLVSFLGSSTQELPLGINMQESCCEVIHRNCSWRALHRVEGLAKVEEKRVDASGEPAVSSRTLGSDQGY